MELRVVKRKREEFALPTAAKLEAITAYKETGTALFRAQAWRRACAQYRRGAVLAATIGTVREDGLRDPVGQHLGCTAEKDAPIEVRARILSSYSVESIAKWKMRPSLPLLYGVANPLGQGRLTFRRGASLNLATPRS